MKGACYLILWSIKNLSNIHCSYYRGVEDGKYQTIIMIMSVPTIIWYSAALPTIISDPWFREAHNEVLLDIVPHQLLTANRTLH